MLKDLFYWDLLGVRGKMPGLWKSWSFARAQINWGFSYLWQQKAELDKFLSGHVEFSRFDIQTNVRVCAARRRLDFQALIVPPQFALPDKSARSNLQKTITMGFEPTTLRLEVWCATVAPRDHLPPLRIQAYLSIYGLEDKSRTCS